MLQVRGLTPGQLLELARPRRLPPADPLHVYLCISDHYEPMWRRPPQSVQRERVERWVRDYPRLADRFQDSRGQRPQHTFFYPQDEYLPELVEPIARLSERGYGDVEVHLHHDNDTPDGLRKKLLSFTEALHDKHGMLRRGEDGRLRYAFIHGNWALNNSRPDGRWCGVDDETSVLLDTGCYADMTMPSAPDRCQTALVNAVYYARPNPQRRKGHDRGERAIAGQPPPDNQLLMIQGPLGLDFSSRTRGILPRLENGDLTGARPPTLDRLRLWLQVAPRLPGREDHVFVKLHTHGAQDANSQMLLGEPMAAFHESLRQFAAENSWFRYYYVTAWQLYEVIHSLLMDRR